MTRKRRRDKCQVCEGSHGGVRGNENVMDGTIICDYCTAPCLGNSDLAVAARAALKLKDLDRLLQLVKDYQVWCRQRREAYLKGQSV